MPTVTIRPDEVSHRDMHQYILSAVAPRPICFASTISADGQINLSPYSFFNVFSSNPPLMIFSAALNRESQPKDTLLNVKDTKEVVINMVNYAMVEQMSLASTAYPKGVNEFVKAGFTAIPSEQIGPPRVAEAPVAFECVVEEIKEMGNWPGAGNLIFARVVAMHIREEYTKEDGMIDPTSMDLVGRMGGEWYNRTIAESLFEVAKPTRNHGIGIDALPDYIKTSALLNGNELAKMGGLSSIPNKVTLEQVYEEVLLPLIGTEVQDQNLQIINLAKILIKEGRIKESLALLLSAEQILK